MKPAIVPADQSLRPMNIGTPVSAPPRETSSNLVLYLVIAILLALGIVAMLSSGVLAGALLVFA